MMRSFGLASIGWVLAGLSAAASVAAQGLPTMTWPAGTQLSQWEHGGRITTFHRGYLYLGGTDLQSTWTYDISDPQNPLLVRTVPAGLNGHVWAKFGDLWWRQYAIPEYGSLATYPFQNLSDPLNPTQQLDPYGTVPVDAPLGWPGNWVFTYPWIFNADGPEPGQGRIHHARLGWWPPESTVNVPAIAGMMNGPNKWRLGNLLFLTPSGTQDGVAVFDIGDPRAPVLLDRLTGNYRQHSTAWHVWRHYLVLMIGSDTNGPDSNANALVIDFSDPTNLTLVHTIPFDDLPGHFASFQDEYAFAGSGRRGTKYNMLTRQVDRAFVPSDTVDDFQWIPLGHLLLMSGSRPEGSRSFLFTHQDGLDATPPALGYHLPADGASSQPVETVIGLVINETLDATTVNGGSIELRPLDIDGVPGAPVATTVLHTSYQVVNVVPDAPLLPETTYEVRLLEGGIRDVAGNGMAGYSFRFSTARVRHTIVPSAGANGSISPAATQRVADGSTANFTITPAAGYSASVGGTCGGTLVGDTYTTDAIVADCTVTASFALVSHTVTPSATAGGSITPATAQTVSHGASTTFTVAADAGYSASVGGTCGGTLVGDTYTTDAIVADCTVTASFALVSHTVTPSATAGGNITPATAQTVSHGASTTFTVAADAGYSTSVGGTCGGTLVGDTYTTDAVVADCTVTASFALVSHTVTPSATAGGNITPATAQTVSHGASTTFTVTADAGYSASVGGTCGGTLVGDTYTTDAVVADCTVEARAIGAEPTSTTLQASSNPVRGGIDTTFTVVVSGTTTGPSDGSVTVDASTGERCTDAGAPQVSGAQATFTCRIPFATLGPRTLTASYAGSTRHADSSSVPLSLDVVRSADLSVSVAPVVGELLAGETVGFLIEVRNAGPDDAPQTELAALADPALLNASWTCEPVGASTCPAASGAGDIAVRAGLASGTGFDVLVVGEVPAPAPPQLSIDAAVAPDSTAPSHVHDPESGNNAKVGLLLAPALFSDGFEQQP